MTVTPLRLSTLLAQALDWVKTQEQVQEREAEPSPAEHPPVDEAPRPGRRKAVPPTPPVDPARCEDTLVLSPAAKPGAARGGAPAEATPEAPPKDPAAPTAQGRAPEPAPSQVTRKALNAGINAVLGVAAGGLLGLLAGLVWPPLGVAVALVTAISVAFSGIEWLTAPA